MLVGVLGWIYIVVFDYCGFGMSGGLLFEEGFFIDVFILVDWDIKEVSIFFL